MNCSKYLKIWIDIERQLLRLTALDTAAVCKKPTITEKTNGTK